MPQQDSSDSHEIINTWHVRSLQVTLRLSLAFSPEESIKILNFSKW